MEQSLPVHEIIVVDDASTDDTVARIKGLSIPAVRLIELDENVGSWQARNIGLEVATGDWVALIDGDDWWDRERLERILECAHEYAADLVMDDLACVSTTGKRLRTALEAREVALDEPTVVDPRLFVEWDLGVMKPVFRRTFLSENDITFNGALPAGGDFSMFFACLAAGARCILLPEALYVYRFRPGQITGDRKRLFAGTRAATLEAITHADRIDDREVGELLDGRLAGIDNRIALLNAVEHARSLRLPSALLELAHRPQALGWLVGWTLKRLRLRAKGISPGRHG